MPELVTYCDLVMGNIWAADTMLGIGVPENIAEDKKEVYLQQAEISSAALIKAFPNCKTVANTFRFEHNGGIKYYTTLYSEAHFYVSEEYYSDRVINKIGSGDCFMAGLIYGSIKQMQPQETLDFATAAAFTKLFTQSDFSTATVAEINKNKKTHE